MTDKEHVQNFKPEYEKSNCGICDPKRIPAFNYYVRLITRGDSGIFLAGFAHEDSAEKWARAFRNQINRDNKKGPEYKWSALGVRVLKSDERGTRIRTDFLTDEAIAQGGEKTK